MPPKATLSLTAQRRVNELRALGIEPTLDEVIQLHEAGHRIEHPAADADRIILGNPVRAGNVWLWPLTVGASMWWSARGSEWFGIENRIGDYALAYTLAHAREPEVFNALSDYPTAAATVRTWMTQLACTKPELDQAMGQVLNIKAERANPAADDPAELDWLAFLDAIRKALGNDLATWLWVHPMDMVTKLVRRHVNVSLALGEKPDLDSPRMQAVHQEQLVFESIVSAHKEPANV